MKKFIFIFALLAGLASVANTVSAQQVSVSININSQPAWGPIGYNYAGYYYLPEINSYYDVSGGIFVYFDSNRWISARYLPYHYRHYDLYGMYKVVLNVRDPWFNNSYHRRHYVQYRGFQQQVVIRDSRDSRYYSSRNNRVTWYNESNNSRPNNNSNSRPTTNQNVQRPNNSRPSDNQQVTRPANNNRDRNNGQNNTTREVKRTSSSSTTKDYRLTGNTTSGRSSSRR